MADQSSLGDAADMTGSTITAVGNVPSDRASLDRELLKASLKAELFGVVQEPTKVGRFALMKRIAVGGMGEVYAAYDDQLDRKVAIKLVRPDRLAGDAAVGTGGDTAGHRLIREAQTLARLSHPNVVQVYEAGVCGNRVFLAMEFIRGHSLRQWLDRNRETPEPKRWRSILAKFQAAGRGLQAAHAAGLVHRDFKPDNVLIGDDGRVCVADFGLARPVQSDAMITQALRQKTVVDEPPAELPPEELPHLSSLPSLTQSGTVLGTPAYMSPEQLEGAASDWRSDQFGFCVALYEALYGSLPFAATDLRSLHARMSSGAASPPPRRTEVPLWLWKVLERGLAIDPSARYASMGELLAALASDPAKRRRRNLIRGFMGGGGLLALLALWAITLPDRRDVIDPCGQAGASVEGVWNAQRADRARASFLAAGVPYAAQAWPPVQAQLERYAGELRAERKATCVATHVRREQTERVFALAALCLDRREHHLDALVTELERADAQIVERGAEAAAGLPRVDRCRDREALTLGVQPPDDAVTAAKVVRVQTQLATARAQRLSGHPAKARALVQSLLKESEPIAYAPLRAELLSELGMLQRDDGSSEGVKQAEQTFLDAVDLADRTRYDELASDLWVDLTMLAREHHGDLALGHQWARRAVATSWRLNDGGRQRSVALSWLGELHFKEDKYAEAERLHREAIALGQKHGATGFELANRLQRLANTLQRMDGRAAEATQLYERAIAAYDAELGAGHPLVAPVLYNHGIFLQRNGATEEARRAFGRAISIWTAIDGPSLVDVADTHRMLGNLELEAGRLAAAAEHARRCDEIYRTKLTDPDSPKHARLRTLIGRIALRQGRHAEALAALEGALAQTSRISSSSPLILGSLQSHVAEALAMLGRHDRALQTIGEAEKTLAGMKNVPDAFAAMPPRVRGLTLLGKGDARGAAAQLERALSLMRQEPADSLERADAQWALARSLRLAGGSAASRAEALARQALATYQTRADTLGDSGARTREAITRWLR